MTTESNSFTAIVQSSLDAIFQNGNWLATCVLSLIISAVMSSLAWMLSSAFQSNELKGWAKKELSEFVFTGMLIGVAFSLILTISYLTIAYAGGDPYYLAKNFLDTVQADLINSYVHVISIKTFVTFISTFNLNLGWISAVLSAAHVNLPGLLGSAVAIISNLTLNYGNPFGLILGPLSFLESFMQPMFLAMFVQHELLSLIQKIMLPILLPTGILLRAFPLSRKTGSTLIAISIAAYIIYPVSLVMSSAMYNQMKSTIGTLDNLPSFDPSGNGLYVKISPSPGKYYLNESDNFEWKALVPLNYSVWSEIECNKILNCKTHVTKITEGSSSVYHDIPSTNYDCWKTIKKESITTTNPEGISITTDFEIIKCFKLTNNGSVETGEIMAQNLSSASFISDKENEILLTVKSEEKKLHFVDQYSFYFGNPCNESLWSKFYCWLSVSTKENELNDISYLRLTASGMEGFFGGFNTFIKGLMFTVSETSLVGAAVSPVAAGYLFLYLTDKIDVIIFPSLIILFTFVLTITIFISSFKSISQTLGGETEIIEIGRII